MAHRPSHRPHPSPIAPSVRYPTRDPELSQHFLRDPALVRALVRDMRLPPGAPVLDIGAGRGIITEALAAAGCHAIAIEKDPRLYRSLRARFTGRTDVECHLADALAFPLPRIPYVAVSNVPFAITAALVRRLLDAPNPPVDAWLIVQREAARKFAGSPSETMFSLLRKPRFSIDVARPMRPRDFDPPPRVETSLLHIRARDTPLIARNDTVAWRAFVRGAFHRSGAPDIRGVLRPYITRRQLDALARDLRFDPRARPATLSFGQWLALFRFHARACRGPTPPLVTVACAAMLPDHGSRPLPAPMRN